MRSQQTNPAYKCTNSTPAASTEPFVVRGLSLSSRNVATIIGFSGDEVETLAKCEFDGRIYFEGELMESNSCYSCICCEGFEDKPVEENKHCRKVECAMEIHYYEKMITGCIPIYFQTHDCCPLDWRCPDDSTFIIPSNGTLEVESAKSNLKCSFGNLTLNLGDSLSPEDESDDCTLCVCEVPPHPTCIRTCETT